MAGLSPTALNTNQTSGLAWDTRQNPETLQLHPMLPDKSPRRVLIIVENLPVPLDRRVWSEATTLSRAGYQVSVICPLGHGAEATYERVDGIHIYRHPLALEARGALGYIVEYTNALYHELRLSIVIAVRHGFDAIHACNPPDLIFLVGALHRVRGCRFLFDHHDLNPELYEAKFNRRDLFYHLLLWCERLTFRTAHVAIATNESYRQVAITRGRMPPDRVFVVRSGPNLQKIRLKPPDQSWRNGRMYLAGYVGVIGQQEGLDLLIRSVRHIVYIRKRLDVQFVIVGGGPELEQVRHFARQAAVQDFVTFTGRVDDDTLLTVLSTADICVNPDRANVMNDKSTMNKILEYMALGKPIVQFDLTEGRVSAQQASLYAKPNDTIDFAEKILELLDNPGLRETMGQLGRTRVESELSWAQEAPKLLAAYETLFAPKE